MSFGNIPGLPQDGGDDSPLIQLVYRSVSTRGAASALQMSDILAQARPRNAQLGITGVLTAVDGQFVQIIEGPEAGIDILLAKLALDPRHTAMWVLERRPIGERAFGDWEMVSPRLAGLEAAQVALLLSVEAEEIDQFVPVLKEGIRRQEAVLEGSESPASSTATAGLKTFASSQASPDNEA